MSRKKNPNRMIYLCEYDGDSVYEPAEGGYYVEVSHLVNAYPMTYKHARRKLRQIAAMYAEDAAIGVETIVYSDAVVVRRSHYVGDFTKYKLLRDPLKGEQHYHGYC